MSLFGRRRDEELDEEIRSHLRMAVRDRVEHGETPEQAKSSALREFGNTGQDFRYGLRMMRRGVGSRPSPS